MVGVGFFLRFTKKMKRCKTGKMKQTDTMLTLCPLVKNVKSFIKSHTSLKWPVRDFFVFKIISWYIIVEKAKHQKKGQY